VDIAAGDDAVRRIAPHAARTARPEVEGGLGGFGAAFAIDPSAWRQPLLVSATDGVGTKLLVAQAAQQLDTIGIDLVAMCVNDIVVGGAEPLFFLDYIATGALDPAEVEIIVSGIADGCELAGCSLIGGETAELPGMYAPGSFDLAGFTVGIVERDEQLGAHRVTAGDALIGIASTGLHSNGYSLARRALLEGDDALALDAPFGERGRTLADALLEPTAIYVRELRELLAALPGAVHAAAHITGGGVIENVPRALPHDTVAHIDPSRWPTPPIFELIAERSALHARDAHRVFNMGIGMVLVVDAGAVDAVRTTLHRSGRDAWQVGMVTEDVGPPRVELMH
jgi:phosphoribosylformylglycinamidine cyclo-ligase